MVRKPRTENKKAKTDKRSVRTSSDYIITMSDIYKSYGEKHVLKGVDLAIEKGQIYGLIGKNGAGKSTIFKVLLGLSDYTSGKMEIGHEGDTLAKGRSRIGFLVGNNYFPYGTARANLNYYADLKNIKNKKEEIDRVLKLVELDQVKTKVKGFSLGMKQRLGIANALLGNPEILILDEPTNGLDPQGIMDIRKLIQRLNKEYGMTVIVSSHILGELQNTAHKFAILNEGVIVKVLSEEDLTVAENTVKIKVDNLDKALAVLEEAGIETLNVSKDKISLEEFYFSLIGGGDHA